MIKRGENTLLQSVLLPVFIFLAVLIFVLLGVKNIGSTALEGQLDAMAQSLRRSTVQCYVLEGAYPQNLEYLAENYNVSLNNEDFIYHYNYWGSNIMPDIFVFHR